MAKNNIAPETIEEIIRKSGHQLHLKVAAILEKQGWETIISPYYIDEISNKPREIDIVARKRFAYRDKTYKYQYFYFVLGIDCKYLTHNSAIWFRENKLRGKAFFHNMRSRNDYFPKVAHTRYSESYVGRLISEGDGAGQLQEGILQAVKATLDIFNRGEPEPTIYFPAVVYGLGEKIEIHGLGDGVTGTSEHHPLENDLLYHVDYAYMNGNEPEQRQFYVDLVNEKKLIDFTQKLQAEGEMMQEDFTNRSVRGQE